MKNVKKLLKKAMVFTLAASMLVGTPLTASAAGIRGVYSVSDGTTTTGGNSDTGTVTNTDTNTGVLSENETKIVDFVLDQEYVRTEINANPQPVLKATVILDGAGENDPELVAAINKLIRWETSDSDKVSIDVKASDRTTATLKPKKAANVGEEVEITASIGGNYPFTYTYTDEETHEEKTKVIEGSDVYRKKTAKVFVKEYAENLWFEKDGKQVAEFGKEDGVLVKHMVDMNQWLKKDPATANDTVTWSISKTNAASISEDGIVTVKKYDTKKAQNNTFTVTAVSEKGHAATASLTVDPGVQASKVTIYESRPAGEDDVVLKGTRKVDVGGDEKCEELEVRAVMSAKVDTKDKNKVELEDGAHYIPKGEENEVELTITDAIEWKTSKDKIVEIEPDGNYATLKPIAVGTAKITATATSGKKASFSVKVSATLNGLEVNVDTVPGTAYTGQTYTLDVNRDPESNNDALAWSVYEDAACTVKSKDVTINAKGVLKVKNTLKTDRVYVKVQSKKGNKIANTDSRDKNTYGPQSVDIALDQSSINGIVVTDITNPKNVKPVIKVELDERSRLQTEKTNNAKTDIRFPLDGVYQAQVLLDEEAGDRGDNETLTWTNSNSKVADLSLGDDGVVTIKTKAKGTTKITVSGIKVTKWDDEKDDSAKQAKVIKAQFTVNVVQPTTSVTLNKSDIVIYPKLNKKGEPQKQAVSLKATLNPKGAADPVYWKVYNKDGRVVAENTIINDLPKLTDKTKASGKNNVNYKLEMKAPVLGDEYTVVATSQTGVSATATIRVLQKPTSIEIHDPEQVAKDNHVKFSEPKATGNGTIANTKYVYIGTDGFDMCPEVKVGTEWFKAGDNLTEAVTYTQKGQGKVNIVGNHVYGVKEGKVTITAKTPNNKTTTLKVEVKAAK